MPSQRMYEQFDLTAALASSTSPVTVRTAPNGNTDMELSSGSSSSAAVGPSGTGVATPRSSPAPQSTANPADSGATDHSPVTLEQWSDNYLAHARGVFQQIRRREENVTSLSADAIPSGLDFKFTAWPDHPKAISGDQLQEARDAECAIIQKAKRDIMELRRERIVALLTDLRSTFIGLLSETSIAMDLRSSLPDIGDDVLQQWVTKVRFHISLFDQPAAKPIPADSSAAAATATQSTSASAQVPSMTQLLQKLNSLESMVLRMAKNGSGATSTPSRGRSSPRPRQRRPTDGHARPPPVRDAAPSNAVNGALENGRRSPSIQRRKSSGSTPRRHQHEALSTPNRSESVERDPEPAAPTPREVPQTVSNSTGIRSPPYTRSKTKNKRSKSPLRA